MESIKLIDDQKISVLLMCTGQLSPLKKYHGYSEANEDYRRHNNPYHPAHNSFIHFSIVGYNVTKRGKSENGFQEFSVKINSGINIWEFLRIDKSRFFFKPMARRKAFDT